MTSSLPEFGPIKKFFNALYEKNPTDTVVGKNLVFSVNRKNAISVMLDRYGGCHVNIRALPNGEAETINKMAKIRALIEQLGHELKKKKACDSLWINLKRPFTFDQLFSILPESFMNGALFNGRLIDDWPQNQVRIWEWLNNNKKCTIPSAEEAHRRLAAKYLLLGSH